MLAYTSARLGRLGTLAVLDRDGIREQAESLKGRRTGLSYTDLARILSRCGVIKVSENGSHRTWKHSAVPDHLTLVDKGSKDVLPVYISKTRKYLLQIAEVLHDG